MEAAALPQPVMEVDGYAYKLLEPRAVNAPTPEACHLGAMLHLHTPARTLPHAAVEVRRCASGRCACPTRRCLWWKTLQGTPGGE